MDLLKNISSSLIHNSWYYYLFFCPINEKNQIDAVERREDKVADY